MLRGFLILHLESADGNGAGLLGRHIPGSHDESAKRTIPCVPRGTAHAAKPRTKWMKNGILGLRSKAGGRFAIKSASLERGQATFEHTELRFDRVH